jgi:hypothetical protein
MSRRLMDRQRFLEAQTNLSKRCATVLCDGRAGFDQERPFALISRRSDMGWPRPQSVVRSEFSDCSNYSGGTTGLHLAVLTPDRGETPKLPPPLDQRHSSVGLVLGE